jgi:hypothetical protein
LPDRVDVPVVRDLFGLLRLLRLEETRGPAASGA